MAEYDDIDPEFEDEMKGVKPLPKPNVADLPRTVEITPGHLVRRRAAVADLRPENNPLAGEPLVMLGPHDVLSFCRPGIQTGVFRKLRLGQYSSEARLDLHRMTVEDARREVFRFVRDCLRYELRTVIILHGKGERNADKIAPIKSYLAHWLPHLDGVMAFHSAQPRHGGTGAAYVLLRKGEKARLEAREQYGG